MTTASDLRADAQAVLIGEGVGQPITLSLSASAAAAGGTYDPATGNVTSGSGSGPTDLGTFTGMGRITRFSDALAAGGLIQNDDRKIVWYPDDPAAQPAIDGIMAATNADGSTDTFRVVAWNARTLGGAVVHFIVQGRR